jgi:selenocysteine-specific elongation factor
VQGTFLAEAPIIPTSAVTGMGLDQLKTAIAEACRQVEARAGREWFRIAIDRSFVVQGHGTIVTGSVTAGSVRVGDELAWLPKGDTVRVRSLHNHDKPVEEVHRGQRAAINLAGVPHEAVVRGQELATPGYLIRSRTLTVRLLALADVRRPLKHRTEVRLHIGTAEAMATLSLLDCDALQPGHWALAQLFLDEPVTAVWGQPFVLRESSAVHTLGGGQVLQPVARKIRRRHLELLERVEKLWTGTAEERALNVAWFTAYAGVTVADLVRGGGFGPDDAEAMIGQLKQAGKLVEVSLGHARTRLLHVELLDDLDQKLLNALGDLHVEFPLMTTHDRQKVQSLLSYVEDDALVHAAVDRLIQRKKVIGDLRRIARADFKPKLSANLRKLKDKLVLAYRDARFTPPDPASFAGAAGGNAANLGDLFEVCIAEGYLVRIAPDIYLHTEIETEMKKLVADKLSQAGAGLTVAEIRDLLGTTRKYAVPLCEYLDRTGVTRREGDLRVLNAAVIMHEI